MKLVYMFTLLAAVSFELCNKELQRVTHDNAATMDLVLVYQDKIDGNNNYIAKHLIFALRGSWRYRN